MEPTLSPHRMLLTVSMHSFEARSRMPVALMSVWLTAMKMAAGTPLPLTSAMANPIRWSSIGKRS